MRVDVRHAAHPQDVKRYETEMLREHFLVETVFIADEICLTYSHYDRMIIGGIVPTSRALVIEAPAAVGQATFLAEREMGAINLGGTGSITVDGETYDIARFDCLYIGKGAADVSFSSASGSDPARFYIVSTPAHETHPNVLLKPDQVRRVSAGEKATANERTIFQYVHPDVCQSCQLTMGLTRLAEGSVWNTMPSHTHDRRSEAYLYFDMDPAHRVFHFMGEPQQTRHMLVASDQAIISPPWSIHSGVGTSNYSFIWAMGGDNKSFTDMDHLAISELR
ncbi:5-dehydro-4-deoxy-D-glucuronate isomerase [Shinella sp. 838]|uniref:5-dehydro-4-deoxy-D-glucuronate isomerase n=1 Tax=Shinella sp. 838 TaxID=3038164 RepID=UPI002414E939|nr:5-dehydro-4-deoxy-D-glucuronate isomerase [Shinella sp. 838]MDG4674812.1 5-dehydro-4-deoxy-D-glucuronate isomerase [Shinella sp. 838]